MRTLAEAINLEALWRRKLIEDGCGRVCLDEEID